MAEGNQRQKVYCNECKRETWHDLRGSHPYSILDDLGDGEVYPAVEGSYRFWTCAGCDTGTLHDDYMEYGVRGSIFYPKRTQGGHTKKSFLRLPSKLRTIHHEVVNAYNEGLHLLCAVGLRSLLEGICADKGVTGATLNAQISSLREHLPSNIVDNLHGFRFLGNRAVHELESPSMGDLRLAIEVVEDLLNFLYELDYKASQFGAKTLSRKPVKAKAPKKGKLQADEKTGK